MAYLTQLLAPLPWLHLVGTARGLPELEELVSAQYPAVLVSETTLAGQSTLPAIERFIALQRPLAMLILSVDGSEETVLTAVAAGIRCYWLKEHAVGVLPEVIRRCANGEAVLDDQLVGIVLDGYRHMARGIAPVPARLGISRRADEVLRLMSAGLRNRDIAAQLGLSEHTVKIYVSQVFTALGVKDRTSAVLEAMRRGLLKPAS